MGKIPPLFMAVLTVGVFTSAVLLQLFPPAAPPPEALLAAHADDYVFGYYPHGWRGRDATGDIVFAVHGRHYALLVNASKARVEKSGSIAAPKPAEQAAQQDNGKILDPLPLSPLSFQARAGATTYDAIAGAPKPDAVVIQRLGKYLVNVEVRDITLQSADGKQLEGANAKILLYCWPDHARAAFQLDAVDAQSDVVLSAHYAPDGSDSALRGANLLPGTQTERDDKGAMFVESKGASLNAGESATVCIGLFPKSAPLPSETNLAVRAKGIAPYTGDLTVTRDPVAGSYQILLGENADIWTMERVALELENTGDVAQSVSLAFAKRGGGFGITGMSPVLCDASGAPLGLPVQISKNWHCTPPWFDGITVVQLEPHTKHTLEFRLAYAKWGANFAVSHAQLALEGWGTHQLWDECAIGSFGESVTYDPDVNLNRSMVDDIRPLMVWGMGKEAKRMWSWTHNVGGADFLVLEQDGKRQYLGRQKTEYEAQGPVMTTVRYSGETPDGAVQSHITTQSWSSDDYVRALYTLRYDVTKPVAFSRIAFFQLGADHYNTNLFREISRGDLEGAKETWAPPMGGKAYSRERLPLEGEKPWLAITGNVKNPPPEIEEGDQGAWADRGFIVHRWSARLGGAKVAQPHYAVYGTEDGNIPSALVELAPPPGLDRLEAGDFVEAQVEMVIVPQKADDYYGPNAPFGEVLRRHTGDGSLVHREAVGAAIEVNATKGVVKSQWPVMIQAKSGVEAAFTIEGGCGAVPITILGAKRHAPFSLTCLTDGHEVPVNPSPSNDWWQTRYHASTGTYDITFTLPLDSPTETPLKRAFTWTLDLPPGSSPAH
ncbi:MAG: hypothetical protein WC655_10715 [Candidatus Hydrogenedentales bacterium]|jgi:hypothetical protein